ncbi:MAG: sulfur carrier protein ThiS [Alphaproteobacteria bacterium]|jgi:sulfur carrier protein|nr:sulfur carrier protein ThiS [Alphaproteobacteria bacterium]
MNISVNGEIMSVHAKTLGDILDELGYKDQRVATAVNAQFVSSANRNDTKLSEGDMLEIVTPRQGG